MAPPHRNPTRPAFPRETTLAQRVEALCERHGGLRPAARALGLNPTYLLYLRTGERSWPSDATLRKLGLGRSVTYFQTETDDDE